MAATAEGIDWREFHFVDATSKKFWKIKLDGDSHTVNFGRLGTSGQAQSKSFDSTAAAKKDYDKLIAQKTGKGYVEVGAGKSPSTAAPVPAAKPAAKRAAKKVAEPAAEEVPAEESPAEAPAAPPRPPIAATAGVVRELRLDPADWFWALWRDPEPLPRPEPPPFDPAERIARIRKKKGVYANLDWQTLIKAPYLSRQEAEFWLRAMSVAHLTLRHPKTHDHVLAAVEDREFTGNITADEARSLLSGAIPDPMIGFCLGLLLEPTEFYDVVTGYWSFTDHWSRKIESSGWGAWMIPGYARYVRPYLSRAERAVTQDYIRRQTQDAPLPTEYSPRDHIPAQYMLAGIFGVTDVVERYLAALANVPVPAYLAQDPDRHLTMIMTGLGSGRAFEDTWRKLGLSLNDFHRYHSWGELPTGNLLRMWLAHTELNALDVVRDGIAAQTSKDACEALLRQFTQLVVAPEAAPLMLDLSLSCKSPLKAAQWLNEHVATVIAGLALIAVGRDKLAAAALEYLRDKRHDGDVAVINEQLAMLPAEHAAALQQALSGSNDKRYEPLGESETPQPLAEAFAEVAELRMPSGGEFLSLRRLPAVVVGGKKLNDEQVQRLVTALARGEENPKLFAVLKEHAERATLDAFVWSLFEQWLTQAAPSKHKWAMTALGKLGGDQVALKLTPLVRKWPGESQHQRAVTGLECLRAIGSDTALMQLNGIAQKLKFKGLKTKAQEFMEEIARDKGLTRSQLEDRIVPDCDLNERGSRVFDFGPRKFFFSLDSEMKPVVRDEAKKILKDLPKPNSKDYEALANEAVAEWKLLKAQLREVLKVQVGRLEQAMVTCRRWPVTEFEAFLVKHPLMINLARTVVWGAYDAQGKLTSSFRVTEEQDFANVKDNPLQLTGVAAVGIVHPLHLDGATAKAWGEIFADYAIAAPFPQLGRATFKLEAGEEKQKDISRFNGPKIPATSLVGTLERLGWTRGVPEDGGVFHEHSKPFYGADVTAILQYEDGVPVGYMEGWDDQKLSGCFFVPGIYTADIYPDHKKRMTLADVDEVVLSEVLADLTTLVSKAK